MVKVEALEARVEELETEINEQESQCKVEAEHTASAMNWSDEFKSEFQEFLYEKKYKPAIKNKQTEYDILTRYVVKEPTTEI